MIIKELIDIKNIITSSEVISNTINIIITITACVVALRLWTALYKKCSNKLTIKSDIHKKFLNQVVKGTIYVVTVYSVTKQIPSLSDISAMFVSNTSLLVVVLGFAAQESLGDVINGLFLSLFKPFEIGDRVRLVSANITGNIEDITLRHIVIRTVDNKSLVIPNSIMNKEIIENTDFVNNNICNFLDFTISYESDIDKAIDIVKDIVRKHKYFLDYRDECSIQNGEDDVKILIRELGDNGICLRCHVWTSTVSENFEMCSDIRYGIITKFRENNIDIPYSRIEIMSGGNKNE